ncbi:MAG: nucleotidyltransferase family protein [Clostridiales Family XIII bacterium]|jgi:CTP:molybdopterin cytidylyltransferase MocA|nr:nucleotidyltransferase family protein [Clostridiales Family XIII bacterium]
MDEHRGAGTETANIGAVVVAAGMSSRMGAYKPLLEIGGVSVARRVASAFAEAGARPLVVVTGHRAAELEAHLSERRPGAPPLRDLLFVTNARYASTTMYESAKIGLSRIMGLCARTFFCPIDVPLFTSATVSRLAACDAPIVKPIYNGIEGHPILIDSKLIPVLVASESGAGSLKATLAAFDEVTACIEVDDEGILYDADTPSDMKRLTDIFSKREG